jgi:uroporphyrin-III C-methyltransferase
VQLEIEVDGRKVVVVGSMVATRRVVKRYLLAGARVTVAVDGPMPKMSDRLPGVRYGVQPEADQLADWVNLLGPAWLVVLVGDDDPSWRQIRRICDHLRVAVGSERGAVQHGKVTLVGGGPGATGLLTLRACDALREADVVFFDRLAPSADVAKLAPTAELIDVGKRPHHHRFAQPEIEALMIDRARSGASVVRLKGGDPFVFGRGGEEVAACVRAGVAVQVVPGVSSAISVPAAAGIPLTHRGVSHAFTVISGHDPLSPTELSALSCLHGTLVILMGINNLAQITAGLVRAGMATAVPAAVVERGYSGAQRTTIATVCTLAARARALNFQPPAVVVIGEVVKFAGLSGDSTAWLADLEAEVAARQGPPSTNVLGPS